LSTWPRQRSNVPQGERIILHGDHDNRQRARGLPRGAQDDLRTTSNQHVHLALDEFGGEGGEPLDVALRTAELDGEILALHIAEVTESMPKGLPDGDRRLRSLEDADARHFPHLLRLGCPWHAEGEEGKGDNEPDKRAAHIHLLIATWEPWPGLRQIVPCWCSRTYNCTATRRIARHCSISLRPVSREHPHGAS